MAYQMGCTVLVVACCPFRLLWHGASACALWCHPYVVCDRPDVTLMSGFREFCMSSATYMYHMAERPLSRRAGLV